MRLFRDVLKNGDKGPDVAVLQIVLFIEGFNAAITTQGGFGDQTEIGVKALQKHAGLQQTGEFGADEKLALETLTSLDVDQLELEDFTPEEGWFFQTKPAPRIPANVVPRTDPPGSVSN